MARNEPTRGPTWVRDELLLALDLYFRRGGLSPNDAEVVELSQLLSRLPLHPPPRATTFRNPNGVSKKLWNFAGLDPNYDGVGLARRGRGDEEVFERYFDDREELARLAACIRAAATSGKAHEQTEPEEGEDSREEGRILFRLHRRRERNPRLARKKKDAAKERGQFRCEVCGFDPLATYGEAGDAAIECHHVKPLSRSGGPVRTSLEDLALLCASCHRVLHGMNPWPSLNELRASTRGRGTHDALT